MKFFLSLFFLSFTFIALSQRNCGFQHTDNHSFEEELHRVMAHGLLHLLGYKDKSDQEAHLMREKENEKIKLFHVEH